MKKLLMMLVVMAIAAPVFAGDVQFTATDNGDGTATIAYVADAAIRGIALNVDADAEVTAVTVDSFFDVFMDSAYGDPDNYALGTGTPIASQDVAGEIALPSNMFCISMGNLEGVADVDEIVVAAADGTTVTIDINTLRGGIVDTDGAAMTSNLPVSVLITDSPAICVPAADEADFLAVGSPASWCVATQCYGDADGAQEPFGRGFVDVGMVDVDILVSGFRKPNTDANFATWIAADFDRRQEAFGRGFVRVGMVDVGILVANFRKPILTDCND